VVSLALGPQEPDLLDIGRFCTPHARAGGKDLECIRTELRRFLSGAFQGARRRAVDSDSQDSSIVRLLCSDAESYARGSVLRVVSFGGRAGLGRGLLLH